MRRKHIKRFFVSNVRKGIVFLSSDTAHKMLAEGDLVFLWSPAKGDSFLVRLSPGSTQGSHLGQMKHDDIIGMEYGGVIRTNKG